MKISIVEKDHLNVVRNIINQGLVVVHVDGELFIVHEFIPADNVIHKTSIQGINITKLVVNQVLGTQITMQQQRAILNQIEALSAERREYSHHYKWTTYQ